MKLTEEDLDSLFRIFVTKNTSANKIIRPGDVFKIPVINNKDLLDINK